MRLPNCRDSSPRKRAAGVDFEPAGKSSPSTELSSHRSPRLRGPLVPQHALPIFTVSFRSFAVFSHSMSCSIFSFWASFCLAMKTFSWL